MSGNELAVALQSGYKQGYEDGAIKELEKIKTEFDKEIEIKKKQDYSRDFFIGICDCLMLIEFRIAELKGDKCDNDHDCEHCDWVECPELKGETE